MSHKAEVFVLSCIDFRFRKAIQNFLENDLKHSNIDMKTDGGAVMQLNSDTPVRDWLTKNMEIAFSLHGVEKIILINHTDCGAYGGLKRFNNNKEELEFHSTELKQATDYLTIKYPDKIIEAYLAIYGDTIIFEKIV